MTGHEHQVGEVVHHLVDELDVLAGRLEARPRDPGTAEDRDAQLNALGVDRVHLLVVDRHLREGAGREAPDRTHAVRLVLGDQTPDALHAVVRVDGGRGDETVRVLAERLRPEALAVADADEPLLDTPQIHLAQGDGDGVVGAGQAFFGHVLEHVLDGELEVLLGLGVLGLAGDEPVHLFHVGMWEPDHGVHDPDVVRHAHARPPDWLGGITLELDSGYGNWDTGQYDGRVRNPERQRGSAVSDVDDRWIPKWPPGRDADT